MEKSSFFTSLNGDRKYKATDWAAYFANFIGNGVFPNPSSALRVNTNGDMTVSLSSGYAFINGYAYNNTDILKLTIGPADAVLPRIDRVVLRCDFVNREITAKVKSGVFNSNPVPPALQRDVDAYELALCDIRIDPGIMSIAQSKITDQILNSELCGIVTQTVQTIDTTELYRKLEAFIVERGQDVNYWIEHSTSIWETEFVTWFDGIKGMLGEDVAGQLALEIVNIKEKIDKGLKADHIFMSDGNHVQKNYDDMLNVVNKGQKHKLTHDTGTSLDISNTNLNDRTSEGRFMGHNMGNAPDTGWWFVDVRVHTQDYIVQDAIQFTNPITPRRTRAKINGIWGRWRSL